MALEDAHVARPPLGAFAAFEAADGVGRDGAVAHRAAHHSGEHVEGGAHGGRAQIGGEVGDEPGDVVFADLGQVVSPEGRDQVALDRPPVAFARRGTKVALGGQPSAGELGERHLDLDDPLAAPAAALQRRALVTRCCEGRVAALPTLASGAIAIGELVGALASRVDAVVDAGQGGAGATWRGGGRHADHLPA